MNLVIKIHYEKERDICMLVWVIEGDIGEKKGETEREGERKKQTFLLVLLKILSMLHSDSHS